MEGQILALCRQQEKTEEKNGRPASIPLSTWAPKKKKKKGKREEGDTCDRLLEDKEEGKPAQGGKIQRAEGAVFDEGGPPLTWKKKREKKKKKKKQKKRWGGVKTKGAEKKEPPSNTCVSVRKKKKPGKGPAPMFFPEGRKKPQRGRRGRRKRGGERRGEEDAD